MLPILVLIYLPQIVATDFTNETMQNLMHLPRTGKVVRPPSINPHVFQKLKTAFENDSDDQPTPAPNLPEVIKIDGNTQMLKPMMIVKARKQHRPSKKMRNEPSLAKKKRMKIGEDSANQSTNASSSNIHLRSKISNEKPTDEPAAAGEARCYTSSDHKHNFLKHHGALLTKLFDDDDRWTVQRQFTATTELSNRYCSGLSDDDATLCCVDSLTHLNEHWPNRCTQKNGKSAEKPVRIADIPEDETALCKEFCLSGGDDLLANGTAIDCEQKRKLSQLLDTGRNTSKLELNSTNTVVTRSDMVNESDNSVASVQKTLQGLKMALTQHLRRTLTSNSREDNFSLIDWFIQLSSLDELEFRSDDRHITIQRALVDYLALGRLTEHRRKNENLYLSLRRVCIVDKRERIECVEKSESFMCQSRNASCIVDNEPEMMQLISNSSCRRMTIVDEHLDELEEVNCDIWNATSVSAEEADALFAIIIQTARMSLRQDQKASNKPGSARVSGVKMKTVGKTSWSVEGSTTTPHHLNASSDGQRRHSVENLGDITDDSVLHAWIINVDESQSAMNLSEAIPTDLQTDRTSESNLESTLTESNHMLTSEELDRQQNSISTSDDAIEFHSNDLLEEKHKNITEDIDNTTLPFAKDQIDGNTIQEKTQVDKQLFWQPFHMDCSIENDEFSRKRCYDWAMAGYCISNNATRFLWCRKTCLCSGPTKYEDHAQLNASRTF